MLPVQKEKEYYRPQTFIKCTTEASAASVAPICGPPTDFDNERAAQVKRKWPGHFSSSLDSKLVAVSKTKATKPESSATAFLVACLIF